MEAESAHQQALVPVEQPEQNEDEDERNARDQEEAEQEAAARKTLQKAVVRRTVDYTSNYLKLFQARLACPSIKDASLLQPVLAESLNMLPPAAYLHMPASNLTTKFVIGNLNKAKSPINHVMWTPDGRRCMTGATSGEFTVWDGRTFYWESVLQAHEAPVRCMQYTHNEHIIVSSDDNGRIKLWNGRKDNFLDPLHVIPAHREPCRSISIAPTDRKLVSASDDSTIKIYDFAKGSIEATMMGHGGDVRWVDWHPRMGLIASGSKDALAKLWDPRSGGSCVATLHGHKNGIMQVKWNPSNANWLLTASRDQTLKIFDLRTLREINTFQGHTRDVTCCAWHPVHEDLFVSGSFNGSINYWMASRPDPQAVVQGAHDKEVWSLAWHPVGHMLASGSSDLCTKFWCRPRPGDLFQDRQADEMDGLGLGVDLLGPMGASAAGKPPALQGIPGLGGAGKQEPAESRGLKRDRPLDAPGRTATPPLSQRHAPAQSSQQQGSTAEQRSRGDDRDRHRGRDPPPSQRGELRGSRGESRGGGSSHSEPPGRARDRDRGRR